jgi:hypothetical protein
MFFNPKVGQKINYRNEDCEFMQNPSASGGTIWSETGRRGKVYPLSCNGKPKYAFKVFSLKFRKPEIASTTEKIQNLLRLSFPYLFNSNDPNETFGLLVAKRGVINSKDDKALINLNPPLEYAIMMPWIEGERWSNFVEGRKQITLSQSLSLAKKFCNVLADLEGKGLAHCDVSADNFIFKSDFSHIELVDLEEMYGPGLSKPSNPPAGTQGYSPDWVNEGYWAQDADRFAAGILLAEILGWQSSRVRVERYGQTYFDPNEISLNCRRFNTLVEEIGKLDPRLSELFTRIWNSKKMSDCPKIAEWNEVINGLKSTTKSILETSAVEYEPSDDFDEPPAWKIDVEPKLPDPEHVTRYGGLSQKQFLGFLISLPILTILILSIISPESMGLMAGTIQIVSLLAPMIYAALRKYALTVGIYTGTTAVVGYYLDMRGSNIHSFFEWIGVSALAGAVFLALMWIATRSQMQLTHKQYWTREIVASGVGGLLTAVL